MYTQARAFLQRPAAEALLSAHRELKARGYGLIIHDGYRPWYVTKSFWEATTDDKRFWWPIQPQAPGITADAP